jgi:hypothetical protein
MYSTCYPLDANILHVSCVRILIDQVRARIDNKIFWTKSHDHDWYHVRFLKNLSRVECPEYIGGDRYCLKWIGPIGPPTHATTTLSLSHYTYPAHMSSIVGIMLRFIHKNCFLAFHRAHMAGLRTICMVADEPRPADPVMSVRLDMYKSWLKTVVHTQA